MEQMDRVIVLIGGAFAIALLIAWVVLPFAVLGVKPLLKQIVEELQAVNANLRDLISRAPPAR